LPGSTRARRKPTQTFRSKASFAYHQVRQRGIGQAQVSLGFCSSRSHYRSLATLDDTIVESRCLGRPESSSCSWSLDIMVQLDLAAHPCTIRVAIQVQSASYTIIYSELPIWCIRGSTQILRTARHFRNGSRCSVSGLWLIPTLTFIQTRSPLTSLSL